MKELQPTQPDDKVLAAISHFFGLLAAIIIWAIQRDKSEYVRFQTLQAVSFDMLNALVIMLAIGLFVACMVIPILFSLVILQMSDSSEVPEFVVLFMITPMLFPPIIAGLLILYSLVNMLARLIAAIRVLQGKDFRYPWLGKRLERLLYAA